MRADDESVESTESRRPRERRPASRLTRRRLLNLIWQTALVTLSLKLLLGALTGGVTFQADFNGDLYLAGIRILHGLSPYEPGVLQHQAALVQAGGTLISHTFPRYPAPILLASVPFSLMPMQLADVLFMLLSLGSVVLALRLVGVRDWRCYLVTLIACPVVSGTLLGNLSPMLMLGAAAAWRWRGRLFVPGVYVAAVVVGKVFLWPLGVWLMLTRRNRSLALAVGLGLAVTVAAWATIGFAGFLEYPKMLMNIAEIGGGRGASLVAMLLSLGLSAEYARMIALIVAVSLLLLACRLVRCKDGERYAFGLVVMAALTACPVIWSHYLVLLYIPIALLSPRLSNLWFVPMLSIFAPAVAPHGYGWAAAPILGGELVLVGYLCQPLLAELPERYAALVRLYNTGRRSSVAIARAAAPS